MEGDSGTNVDNFYCSVVEGGERMRRIKKRLKRNLVFFFFVAKRLNFFRGRRKFRIKMQIRIFFHFELFRLFDL